jgi:hypothetical protein
MSSMAKMFDGSLIATMSEAPARFTGMSWCFSATSLGMSADDLRVDLELAEVDGGDAVLLGEELRELALLDEAKLRQVVAELPACRFLLFLCLMQLLEADQVFANKKLT